MREMDDRIGYALKRAQQALRGALDGELSELGLTAPQYAALAILEEEPGISSAELARRGFVSAQTMSGVVANLERGGLVERRPHPTHGRILETTLTAHGRTLLGETDRRVRAIERRMTSGLAPEERRQLLASLHRCAGALEGGEVRTRDTPAPSPRSATRTAGRRPAAE